MLGCAKPSTVQGSFCSLKIALATVPLQQVKSRMCARTNRVLAEICNYTETQTLRTYTQLETESIHNITLSLSQD